MESLRLEYWEAFIASKHYLRLLNFLWYQDRPIGPDDFYVMRVLGRGGFGLVNGKYCSVPVVIRSRSEIFIQLSISNFTSACKRGTSGKLYAMKVMNKRRLKMKKSEQLALNERRVLAEVESPFIVNLKYSFHSKDDIYLILDLMTGGDLGYHLHQKGKFPKKECQYYTARIMLALQALHDKDYVYRDLKPEVSFLEMIAMAHQISDWFLTASLPPELLTS
jgi:beta-adrenergic-receptor kinase